MAYRLFLAWLGFLPNILLGQTADPVLFIVEQDTVYRSEFAYIYNKSHGGQAPYTRASLEEYVDLYLQFKLKVQRAREMGLDTLPSLRQELAGYRQSLAQNYLVDQQVLDRLLREAYDRQQQDVDISHVLIALHPLAAPADTLAAYRRALAARREILDGEGFEAVARARSDDPSVAENGGHIGFVTALFPNGYYALETAAYTLEPGELSMPIRSTSGYHLLHVNGRRPARGVVEIAHIMLQTEGKDSAAVAHRIRQIYALLQDGADFAVLARQASEDAATRGRGGQIGRVGINQYEQAFEDAAFAIEVDGAIAPPVRTSKGWHIVKRLAKPEVQPFARARYPLEESLRADNRFAEARRAVVERVQAREGFSRQTQIEQAMLDTISPAFFRPDWSLPAGQGGTRLFALGDSVARLSDFQAFLQTTRAQRADMARQADPREALTFFLDQFEATFSLAYLDDHLESFFPDFRLLMQEYREGILLFEATQREVWEAAAQDSAGLAAFFQDHRADYQWPTRARTTQFFLRQTAADRLSAVRDAARSRSAQDILDQFNTEEESILAMQEKVVPEDAVDHPLPPPPWKTGMLSDVETLQPNGTLTFFRIEEVLPPSPKSLPEARGYVTADYQDFLEKEWVAQLRKKYDVRIHEDHLHDLIEQTTAKE